MGDDALCIGGVSGDGASAGESGDDEKSEAVLSLAFEESKEDFDLVGVV